MKFPKAYNLRKVAAATKVRAKVEVQASSELDFTTWLPFAADTYKISPNISDYVLRKIPLCPSDIPNRNGIAFPLQELIKYQPPPTNRQVYKAWAGCPVHIEHANADPETAIGVILDVSLTPIKGFNGGAHWKVMGLIAIDRLKAPEYAARVESGDLKTGSMGATAESFTCSVCNADAFDTAHKHKNCKHITSIEDVNWRVIMEDGTPKVVFLNAHGITPVEYSLVEDPAWCMSLSDDAFTL